MIFSIIVPIYNVEKYLSKCIESVLNQNMNNFELILVNDGSPDNSANICEYYASRDNRIKVIHKKNGGLSDARNTGLEICIGDYVIFLDGDDTLANGALQALSSELSINSFPDLITCEMNYIYNNKIESTGKMELKPVREEVDRDHFFEEITIAKDIYWSAGKNIYNNHTLKSIGLKFEKNLIGAEDCDFFMNFVRKSNKFLFLDISIIDYKVEREGSITQSMSKEALMGQLKVFSRNYYTYKNNNVGLQIFFANKFANTISLLFKIQSVTDINQCENMIRENKLILNDTKGIKYQIARILWKLFGFYKGSVVLNKLRG